MKRLANYKINFDSKWLTLGGVLFGLAFFMQALDFVGLRSLQGISLWQMIVFMILPMFMEAVWCTCTRVVKKNMAPAFGIFGGVFCLYLCCQAFQYGSDLLSVISILLYLFCGAAMVLISWGYVPHRALGMLLFGVAALIRILSMDILQWLSQKNWAALLNHLPGVCILLGLMVYFMAIHADNDGGNRPVKETEKVPTPQPEPDEPTVKIDLAASQFPLTGDLADASAEEPEIPQTDEAEIPHTEELEIPQTEEPETSIPEADEDMPCEETE